MTHRGRLPVFYACLVLFTVFIVFFEGLQEQYNIYLNEPRDDYRSPKVWGPLLLDDFQVHDLQTNATPTGATKKTLAQVMRDMDGLDTTTTGKPKTTHAQKMRDVAPKVYQEEFPEEFKHTDRGLDPKDPTTKKILVWNSAYGTKTLSFGYGTAPFLRAQCDVAECVMTANRSFVPIQDFDAIIFHFRGLERKKMPRRRSIGQRWVFHEVESASYVYQWPNQYDHLFNWTMTYRRDSDIVVTYGRVYPVTPMPPLVSALHNYAANKTKMAAWFVSNCRTHSKREKLVDGLKKFIQVDVYGKCGQLKCPRNHTDHCYTMLGQHYKFYFSFENSLCKDYVTEKLFNVLKYDVVPVVFGLGDYELVAPPGSYINALAFPTIEGLANHLLYLHHNDTAYNEYFRWKSSWVVDSGWSNAAQPLCDLCKKLHHDTTTKTYHDLTSWFMADQCKTLRTKSWLRALRDGDGLWSSKVVWG